MNWHQKMIFQWNDDDTLARPKNKALDKLFLSLHVVNFRGGGLKTLPQIQNQPKIIRYFPSMMLIKPGKFPKCNPETPMQHMWFSLAGWTCEAPQGSSRKSHLDKYVSAPSSQLQMPPHLKTSDSQLWIQKWLPQKLHGLVEKSSLLFLGVWKLCEHNLDTPYLEELIWQGLEFPEHPKLRNHNLIKFAL